MRLERVVAAVVGGGALALLGGLYVYGRRLRERRGDESDAGADVVSELENVVREATGSKVLDLDAAMGVDPRLLALLAEWDADGAHVIRVANGVYGGHRYVGGVRDLAQQLDDYNANLSKANTPEKAPHMHRGAVDCWPKFFVPNRSFEEQPMPDDLEDGQSLRDYYVSRFQAFADFARARGFVAGFYWKTPDMPHVEVSDWPKLPVAG